MPDRFPAPWTVHHNEDAYWVEDANGMQFGFVYFHPRPDPLNRTKVTKDQARRLVTNFAKLPDLLRRDGGDA